VLPAGIHYEFVAVNRITDRSCERFTSAADIPKITICCHELHRDGVPRESVEKRIAAS
jgi:hypothetical protein